MMVRVAHMADGNVFEVPADGILGCFERGYIHGIDENGDQCVLSVAHVLYFGPRRNAWWLKEVSE